MVAAGWMLFVDGENWTIRGQEVAAAASVTLTRGRFFIPDPFLSYPGGPARDSSTLFKRWKSKQELEDLAVRAYYRTVVGDTDLANETRAPSIASAEEKTRPTKAVTSSLATDILGHAHLDHFDVAVLLAGDGDYMPLVEAVKRLGKRVWAGFFDEYVAREVQLVPDLYF